MRENESPTHPICTLTHTTHLYTHTSTIHTLKAMVPFYKWVCSEVSRPPDSSLLAKMEEVNRKELEQLEEKIEDTEKNFGETEQRDALMAKAEYLCRVGDKVRQRSRRGIPSSCARTRLTSSDWFYFRTLL